MAQVIDLGLHRNQILVDQALDSGKRFIIMRCGRRFGKTELCAREVVKFAASHPNSLIWWVSPFYELSTLGHKAFTEFLQATGTYERLVKKEYKDPHLYFVFRNGAVLRFKTAENESQLMGAGVDFIVFDECAAAKRSAWGARMAPTMIDNPKSRVMFISTPRGRNWLHELEENALSSGGCFYERGVLDPDHPGEPGNLWAVFHYTSYDNPTFTREQVELFIEAAGMTAEEIQQEIYAEYIGDLLEAFPGWRNCQVEGPVGPEAGRRYVAGLDLGHKRDFCAMSVWDVRAMQEVYIERWKDADWDAQKHRAIAISTRWNNCSITMESNGPGDPMIEDLRVNHGRSVEEFTSGSRTKSLIIRNFRVLCSGGLISITKNPVADAEMEAFEIILHDRTGLFHGSAPAGKHDDTVIARMLGAYACTGSFSVSVPDSYRSTGVIRDGYQTQKAM